MVDAIEILKYNTELVLKFTLWEEFLYIRGQIYEIIKDYTEKSIICNDRGFWTMRYIMICFAEGDYKTPEEIYDAFAQMDYYEWLQSAL